MNQLTTDVRTMISEVSDSYKAAVLDHQWAMVPDAQMIAAEQQLTRSSYLMKVAGVNPVATKQAIVNAGILGVDLTLGRRQGWLVPRKIGKQSQIMLQIGYKGVEAIHQRLGVIDRLAVRVVRQNDSFEWSGDDQEKPSHIADWMAGEEMRGPIVGAFSITYYPDKSIQVVVTSINEIHEKHRAASDSWKTYQRDLKDYETCVGRGNKDCRKPFEPPWVQFHEQMVLKTMAFIASKQWPANVRNDEINSAVLAKLNEVETQDYQELEKGYTEEQKTAFDEFVEADNGLALYLFRLYVGDTIYTNLYNSAPKGKKMLLKDACRRLERIGAETLDMIKLALDDERNTDAFEHFEGATDAVIALLCRTIPEHAETIRELTGATQ